MSGPLPPPLDPPMMLVIRVYLSVDESSSSVLYLFQVVDISVVASRKCISIQGLGVPMWALPLGGLCSLDP